MYCGEICAVTHSCIAASTFRKRLMFLKTLIFTEESSRLAPQQYRTTIHNIYSTYTVSTPSPLLQGDQRPSRVMLTTRKVSNTHWSQATI